MTGENEADAGEVTGDDRDAALGQHLRMLRAQRGWSQATLRRKSDVSVATIRSIESSYPYTRQHRRATLTALSLALGLRADYLADYRENLQPEVPAVQPENEFEKDVLERMKVFGAKLDAVMDAVTAVPLKARRI